MARIRGSLVDTVTLDEYPFEYEPVIRVKESTEFGKPKIIGQRLPNYLWVGGGDCHVSLDAFLLGGVSHPSRQASPGEFTVGVKAQEDSDANITVQNTIQKFRALLRPQSDTGAPHPLYINVGSLYLGRKFVMVELDIDVHSYTYDSSMKPFEVRVRMRLEEIPIDRRYAGTGLNL